MTRVGADVGMMPQRPEEEPMPSTDVGAKQFEDAMRANSAKFRQYMEAVKNWEDNLNKSLGRRGLQSAAILGSLAALGLGGGIWYALAKNKSEAKKYTVDDLRKFVDDNGEWSLLNPGKRAELEAIEGALNPIYYDDPDTVNTKEQLDKHE